MTRASIREYTEAVRWRYLRAAKKEKGKILDEFTKVTGYHRKATIRSLHRVNNPNANKKRGRPRQYGVAEVGALRAAWEATDRLCSKRLHPFLPELVKVLRRHGESILTAEVEDQLLPDEPLYYRLAVTSLASARWTSPFYHYQARELAQELHPHQNLC